MSIDFLQVREQIKRLGEKALLRDRRLRELRTKALDLLKNPTLNPEQLREKVQQIARNYDPSLRCALPASNPQEVYDSLDAHFHLPTLPCQATILAADGSQINPDRHIEVNFCLINVGAIQMELNSPATPEISIQSRLAYDDELSTESGFLTDAELALARDLNERQRLVELAAGAKTPVISFTDGPLELWGGREGESHSEFQKSLELYIDTLNQLRTLKVTTAGYVDKPGAALVVRLLEVALASEQELPDIKKCYPFRGIIDIDLFRGLIGPGERSAVFAIQSRLAPFYRDDLALHFFYLNLGKPDHPWLARVEIPAWVAHDQHMVDNLHAILVQQCQIMGKRPYPYLLHRAHEAAVVSMEEKEQVTQMIVHELRRRGVDIGEISHKQAGKNLGGRRSFNKGGRITQ